MAMPSTRSPPFAAASGVRVRRISPEVSGLRGVQAERRQLMSPLPPSVRRDEIIDAIAVDLRAACAAGSIVRIDALEHNQRTVTAGRRE
jgi:hypothetical protein